MRIRDWLIPQEKIFFELLQKESRIILMGVKELDSLLKNYKHITKKKRRIKEIEIEVDEIVHEIYDRLCHTFITPVDHEDIARLASFYDDVIDLTNSIATRLYLFKIEKPNMVMKKFCQILLKEVQSINKAILSLPTMNRKEIEIYCTEVHRLENTGDYVLERSLAKLFNGDESRHLEIIKLKEIYEFFEEAIDKGEHVTNILRNIVMKNL